MQGSRTVEPFIASIEDTLPVDTSRAPTLHTPETTETMKLELKFSQEERRFFPEASCTSQPACLHSSSRTAREKILPPTVSGHDLIINLFHPIQPSAFTDSAHFLPSIIPSVVRPAGTSTFNATNLWCFKLEREFNPGIPNTSMQF